MIGIQIIICCTLIAAGSSSSWLFENIVYIVQSFISLCCLHLMVISYDRWSSINEARDLCSQHNEVTFAAATGILLRISNFADVSVSECELRLGLKATSLSGYAPNSKWLLVVHFCETIVSHIPTKFTIVASHKLRCSLLESTALLPVATSEITAHIRRQFYAQRDGFSRNLWPERRGTTAMAFHATPQSESSAGYLSTQPGSGTRGVIFLLKRQSGCIRCTKKF